MKKKTLLNKILQILKNEKFRKWATGVVFGLALIMSFLTYLIFSGLEIISISPTTVILLLNVDLLILLLLAALVIRKVVKLWLERRRNTSGSGLHMRLVLLFMVVAGLPTIMVTIFSAIFFNVAIRSWFSDQVQTAVEASLFVAEEYYKENRQSIANDAMIIANELNNEAKIIKENEFTNKFLANQLQRQHINELVLVDSSGNVRLQAGDMSSLQEEPVPRWTFIRANEGGVAVNLNASHDKIRAMIKLSKDVDAYLYIGRDINPEMIAYINRAKTAITNYKGLVGQRYFLEITFTVIFIVIALILFLGAVWIGLGIASRMISPIASLIYASEKVAKGDTNVNVEELDSKDELAQLVASFNEMISQITMQKNELIAKNLHIDERRRLIEAILSGVSSGIVNVTKDMRIRMANVQACNMLGNLDEHKGEYFEDVTPQLKWIIKKLGDNLFKNIQENIEVVINGVPKQVLVRVIGEYSDNDIGGYVFTFDDMSELQEAQRKAAWGDVARRIAHEIKNPLTPIQLSAERLLKKYKETINEEAFLTCVNTIIRQVQDIGRMVDEFARFAKMPSPKLGKYDIADIIKEEMLQQQGVFDYIRYSFDEYEYSGKITCDKGQIAQVINNILKNAAESIDAKIKKTGEFDAFISVSLKKDGNYVITKVEDNGKGIAKSDLHRITEPYMTTKEKGTGIGLAIVKKIVEDHKGILTIENREDDGAIVKFSLEI